jgi:hypothetical protein
MLAECDKVVKQVKPANRKNVTVAQSRKNTTRMMSKIFEGIEMSVGEGTISKFLGS